MLAGRPANIKTQNLELAGCPANVKTQNLELAGAPQTLKLRIWSLRGAPQTLKLRIWDLRGAPQTLKLRIWDLRGAPQTPKQPIARLATPLQGIPIGKGAPFLHRIRVDLIAGICLGIESDTRLITIISARYDFRPKSGEEGVRRGVQTMLKATSYRADARNAVHFVLSLRHVKHRFSMKYD